MTPAELARRLDGLRYGTEPSKALQEAARMHGLVIVYGASDDLLELRGAWDDEYGEVVAEIRWYGRCASTVFSRARTRSGNRRV